MAIAGDPAFTAACEHARARWPGVALDEASFAEVVAAALVDDATTIAALHTDDLWLAAACVRGDAGAIATFERELVSSVPAMVARVGLSNELLDELVQRLRERLLVTTPTRSAALAGYAGRGSLAGWLKVVAMREAIALAERSPWSVADGLDRLVAPGHDPEFDHMRAHYGEAFHTALLVALDGLSARERDVLRGSLVERMSIDRIAELHQVHRATAARWLVAIREQIAGRTKDALMSSLAITPTECDSILRLLRSQLDITLGSRLAR